MFGRSILVAIPLNLVPEKAQWYDGTHENIEDFLDALWMETADELFKKEYAGREHDLYTYRAGCRGPLCKAANRAHARKYSGQVEGEHRLFWLDQIIAHYKHVAEASRSLNLDLAHQATVNGVILPDLDLIHEKGLLKPHELSEWALEQPA